MRKKVVALILIVAGVVIALSCLALNSDYLKPIKYVTGKDTITTIGDGKFQLVHSINGTILEMFKDSGVSSNALLAYVEKYKKKGGKLYVSSKEGFGVVDGTTNICKLFVTVEKQYYGNGRIKSGSVIYLNSFDEFTEDEKSIFNSLK